MSFNTVLTTNPPRQRLGNLRIEALNNYAKLYITKITGEDTFSDYTVDFYDTWFRVRVDNKNHWYSVKNTLNIREVNNTTDYQPSQK